MPGGIGQSYAGTGTTITSAFSAAPGSGVAVATLLSLNSVNLVTAWVWCRQPQDASLNSMLLKFGATVLANIPLNGGTIAWPIPISVLNTGDGATNYTVTTANAFIGPVIAVLFQVAQASG